MDEWTQNQKRTEPDNAATWETPNPDIPALLPDPLSKTPSYFRKLKSLLSDHKPYFAVLVLVFLMSSVLGYFLGYVLSYSDPDLITTILDQYADIGGTTTFELFIMIFLNNVFVTCLAIVFGFVLGLVPLFIVIINGAMIGLVFEYISREQSVLFFFLGVLPHGVIEIPVFLLSGAVGLRFGVRLFLCLFGKVPFSDIKKDFLNSFWILFFFIIPMLFAAAFVESYITAKLLELFF